MFDEENHCCENQYTEDVDDDKISDEETTTRMDLSSCFRLLSSFTWFGVTQMKKKLLWQKFWNRKKSFHSKFLSTLISLQKIHHDQTKTTK